MGLAMSSEITSGKSSNRDGIVSGKEPANNESTWRILPGISKEAVERALEEQKKKAAILTPLEEYLTSVKAEVLAWTQNDPLNDHILMIRADPKQEMGRITEVVAGSAALRLLMIAVRQGFFTVQEKFTPTDTDVWLLDRDKPLRLKIGDADMIHTKHKTVTDLLEHFDLPICRVAQDMYGNLYVSKHCLAALWTGKYPIPDFMTDKKKMAEILKLEGREAEMLDSIWRWAQHRLLKYTKRGFHAIPVVDAPLVAENYCWFAAFREYALQRHNTLA